ncbi:serine protease snake-like [Leptopilina heterotoma]|uniref:serine protease snake-like n=1 Tax=Leptopilina heterotoma TaxID=63436 RepID=UPI001CA8ABD4|nr:serine protease snake-like [Leptopilina heterotoma]
MKVNLYLTILCMFLIQSFDSQESSSMKMRIRGQKIGSKEKESNFAKLNFFPKREIKILREKLELKREVRNNYNINKERNYFPKKRKCERMCEKYGKMSRDAIWVQYPTNFDPIPITLLNCDRNWNKFINPLIGGGVGALFGEFPHMAILAHRQLNSKLQFACVGSLISEKWILTAAHCSYKIFIKTAVVYLGSNRLMDTNGGQVFFAKQLIIHPAYQPRLSYADIALVELDRTVQFGLNLKPACLQFDKENEAKLMATGWGTSQYGGELSVNLLKAQLDVIDNVNCSTMYKNSINLPWGIVDSLLCAGDPTGNWEKDTCSGDSGSPLQIRNIDNCLFKIIGITSTGKFCGVDAIPGIYTRVAAYVNWIEEIVWPHFF